MKPARSRMSGARDGENEESGMSGSPQASHKVPGARELFLRLSKSGSLYTPALKHTSSPKSTPTRKGSRARGVSTGARQSSVRRSLGTSARQPAARFRGDSSPAPSSRAPARAALSMGAAGSDSSVAFVIDNGSGIVKAGFGSEERPALYKALVGRPKYRRVMIGASRRHVMVGRRCARMMGVLRLSYPTEAGIVSNWSDLEALWAHTYEDSNAKPEAHRVLITEPPLAPMKNRIRTAEIFIEGFQAPSLCFQLPQVLSLYANGKTTGLVLDSGDTLSQAVPIYDGRFNPAAVSTMRLAGRHVTQYLSKLLQREGYNLTTTAELEVVRRIKHRVCQTAFNLQKAEEEYDDLDSIPGYKLPDGTHMKIGLEKFQAPELLFRPSLMGRTCPAIHQIVVDAVRKCPLERRRQIFSQILLAGGSTHSRGFGIRLLSEVRKIAQYPKFSIAAPPERVELAWIGGSILTTMSIFPGMSASRAEFMEHGAQIFYKKRARDGVTASIL